MALAQLPTWNRDDGAGRDNRVPARAEPLQRQFPPEPPAASAEDCVRRAFAHLEANRRDAALEAARAACYAEPQHLIARLLLGQLLLSVDVHQGRRVLRGLSEDVARLDKTEALPYASELSVEQLRSAVQLLLESEDAR